MFTMHKTECIRLHFGLYHRNMKCIMTEMVNYKHMHQALIMIGKQKFSIIHKIQVKRIVMIRMLNV